MKKIALDLDGVVFDSENIFYIKMNKKLEKDYMKMYNNPEIQKNLFKKLYNKEQIEEWIIKMLSENNNFRFSMIEKSTNDYIGNIEIVKKDNDVGEIMISITQNKQNNHYGSESVKSVIKYANDNLGINNFEVYVYKNNVRAIHCYEKAGFVVNGNGLTEDDVNMKYIKR